MTLYVIRGDSVTAHSSAPPITSQGALAVQAIEDIEASGLSKAELTTIWNALPGTTKLAKFKDRKTAAQRLWVAFAELPVELPGATAPRAGSKQAQVIDLFRLPRITVDWDTSQADDFRTRGVPWSIK
jgi:hypothetical protein